MNVKQGDPADEPRKFFGGSSIGSGVPARRSFVSWSFSAAASGQHTGPKTPVESGIVLAMDCRFLLED
jgi:hypothetical protein